MKKALLTAGILTTLASAASAQLLVDFGNPGGSEEPGWQYYTAGHEVAADFVTQNFSAFSTSVALTPSFPDTTDNRVMQMIDRSAANDANYTGILPDVMTDWIGADARTANGGNGNEAVTSMALSIVGLPAGDYGWLSYHHDTENMHSTFGVSLDGASLGDVTITHSTVNNGTGAINPTSDPATFAFNFSSNGTDPVQIGFAITPPADANVHQSFIAMNGLAITQVPEPTTGLLLSLAGGFLFLRRRR